MANKKHRKNGEGTLFKRKDGRYQASFIPENGKRKYVYGKTQAEALDKLRTAQAEDKRGTLATGPRQKLGGYLTQWLEQVHKPMIRVGTYVQYRTAINKHLIPGLGHIILQKLTPQQVQAFYAVKIKEKMAPGYVRFMHVVLHHAMENAVRWNLVSRNVVSLVSAPRPIRHDVNSITSAQAHKLLEVAKGQHMYAIVALAVTTGMRRGEILALHWSDIDFQANVLFVRHTVNQYVGYGYVENDPKTKSSRRKIVLPNIVIEALQAHRFIQEEMRLKAGDKWVEHNLIFSSKHGDYLHSTTLGYRFHKLLDAAGLPSMRFHDLRHSAATILLTMGIHPKVVQELLGHSSIAMTIDIYSHVLPSMQQGAMEKINDAFHQESKGNDVKKDQEDQGSNKK